VNVVLHATDEDWGTIEPFGNLSQIRGQQLTNLAVPKEWTAVFGGEDQVKANN
jgi:hypothetical protein